jgi:hypothetical protein
MGIPKYFVGWNPYIGTRSLCKIHDPKTTLSGRKVMAGERREKREERLLIKNSGLPKLLRWSHTLCSVQQTMLNSFGWLWDWVRRLGS